MSRDVRMPPKAAAARVDPTHPIPGRLYPTAPMPGIVCTYALEGRAPERT